MSATPKTKQNSSFTEAVYQVVRGIPTGSTRSYQEVATLAGSPHAYRRVATLMKQNFNPDIPCHRVIKSNGTLGDYNRGGNAAKRAILESEGAL